MRLGSLMMLASGVVASSGLFRPVVGDLLRIAQQVGELRQDAPGQRDVAGLDHDPGGVGEASTTGRNDCVARNGASSVSVYRILGVLDIAGVVSAVTAAGAPGGLHG